MRLPERTGTTLLLAGLAAMLASGCCVVPLVLVVLGVSGAWISRLRVLSPYSTALMVLAILLLAVAAWQLFRTSAVRPAAVCAAPGGDCATGGSLQAVRRWFWLVVVLTLIPLLAPLWAPLFY